MGNKRNVTIASVLIVIVIIGTIFGVKQYQEKEKQEQAINILAESETYYEQFDFDNVLKYYDELDNIKYDTTDLRAIAEYDKSVYQAAETFYKTVCDVDTKLHSENYSSLSGLMNTLKKPMKEFDALEINMDSKIGIYINNTRNNIMYTGLESEYVNGDKYDLDYELTSWGFAEAIAAYTEVLVTEEFPYEIEK